MTAEIEKKQNIVKSLDVIEYNEISARNTINASSINGPIFIDVNSSSGVVYIPNIINDLENDNSSVEFQIIFRFKTSQANSSTHSYTVKYDPSQADANSVLYFPSINSETNGITYNNVNLVDATGNRVIKVDVRAYSTTTANDKDYLTFDVICSRINETTKFVLFKSYSRSCYRD